MSTEVSLANTEELPRFSGDETSSWTLLDDSTAERGIDIMLQNSSDCANPSANSFSRDSIQSSHQVPNQADVGDNGPPDRVSERTPLIQRAIGDKGGIQDHPPTKNSSASQSQLENPGHALVPESLNTSVESTSGPHLSCPLQGDFDSSDQSSTISFASSMSATMNRGRVQKGMGTGAHHPLLSIKSHQIRVEFGLVDDVAQSLKVTPHSNTSTLFAVFSPETGVVEWRFLKDYPQLRKFSNLIKAIVDPVLSKSHVKLTEFPPKNYFVRNIPWKVDVRIDMLNAYFWSLSALYTDPAVAKRPKIRNALDQAFASLWFHDIVDLPNPIGPLPEDPEMFGCLLSRDHPNSSKWTTNYCVLNGAYLDVTSKSATKPITRSISLYRAKIVMKICFFDTTDDDERYSIKIHEKSTSGYQVHQFSAESEPTRQQWLAKLRNCVARIGSKEISRKYRRYTVNELPVPYKPRPSLRRSVYKENVKDSHNRDISANTLSNEYEKLGSNSNIKFYRSPRGSGRLSIDDAIQAEEESIHSHRRTVPKSDGSGLFDGEDFYMKISQPMNFQTLCEGSKSLHSQAPLLNASQADHSSYLGHSKNISEPYVSLAPQTQTSTLALNPPLTKDIAKPVKGNVFGIPPNECAHLIDVHDGNQVPTVVARCVERLEQPSSLRTIGLFRISGTQTLLDVLQDEFEKTGDAELTRPSADIPTIADLLKRYLRSLPKSILGEWAEDSSQAISNSPKDAQIAMLRVIMSRSHPTVVSTAHSILRLLHRVSLHHNLNAMSLWNVSVALSPALKVPTPVLQIYIQHHESVFDNLFAARASKSE